jgi:hypothetical protein
MRKFLALVALIFIVYAISRAPGEWATAFDHGGARLGDAADGFGTFLTRLFS